MRYLVGIDVAGVRWGSLRRPMVPALFQFAVPALRSGTDLRGRRSAENRHSWRKVAEGEGFEPSVRLPVQRFSRAEFSVSLRPCPCPIAPVREASEADKLNPCPFCPASSLVVRLQIRLQSPSPSVPPSEHRSWEEQGPR